jgi:hypothetical protein
LLLIPNCCASYGTIILGGAYKLPEMPHVEVNAAEPHRTVGG